MVTGSNNWTQTGLSHVPGSEVWTGTIFGNEPWFVNISTNDVRLISESLLVNAGNISPETFETYPFPNPLFPPTYMPPLHTVATPGGEKYRPLGGIIEIGAYE